MTIRARTLTPSIYVLWAVIALCGFALADFVADSRWVGLFWMVAGPAGFGISAWLGYLASRHAEQGSRRTGARWALHWLAFLATVALGAALVAAGHQQWAGFGSLVVLLLALSYIYAGSYLDRRMLAIGVVVGVSYVITLFVPGYQWTLAGYLVVDKTYRNRRPVTWYQLTAAGQQHLKRHVRSLMRLIDRAR